MRRSTAKETEVCEPASDQRIAVLLCVAEPLMQAGVRASLTDQPDIEVIDEKSDAARPSADVVVADGTSAAKLAERGQSLVFPRILVVAAQTREHAMRSALEHGIHGFVLTSSPVQDLLAGVRALARGQNYLCAPIAKRLGQLSERDMLTSREDEVLRLLAKGRCNKSIARELHIAVGTVKVHVRSIMAKLDASSRTEAASVATGRGLVDVPDTSSRVVKPHPFANAWLASSPVETSYA
jgi:DNA-binding NarL/FixJ family response regulator